MSLETYVEEFLFRGRHSGEVDADGRPMLSDYHVNVGTAVPLASGQTRVVLEQMTPAQAEAAGYPLPDILRTIDAAALRDLDTLRARLAEAEKARHEALEAAKDLTKRLDDAETGRAAALTEVGALRERVAELERGLSQLIAAGHKFADSVGDQ